MNQLYGIVKIFGLIVGTVGPWPDNSMDACLRGARDMEANAPKIYGQKIEGRAIGPGDIQVSCEWRSAAPTLESK